MTPDPHPIRGRVHKDGDFWHWGIFDVRDPWPRLSVGFDEPTLPAAYDRCAAAVAQAREDEAT